MTLNTPTTRDPQPPQAVPAALHDVPVCADDAAELIKALAHGTRMRILCRLGEGECSVGEMEAHLGLRQAAVSQQLARLRAQGLVESRAEGRTRLYRIADPRAQAVVEVLHRLYCIG